MMYLQYMPLIFKLTVDVDNFTV